MKAIQALARVGFAFFLAGALLAGGASFLLLWDIATGGNDDDQSHAEQTARLCEYEKDCDDEAAWAKVRDLEAQEDARVEALWAKLRLPAMAILGAGLCAASIAFTAGRRWFQ